MKKMLYSLFSLTLTAPAIAQPIILNMDKMAVGDKYTYINCSPSGVNPSSGGAGNHWMFDNLTRMDSTRFEVISPGATIYSADFPTANLAVVSSEREFVFYNFIPGETYLSGFVDSPGNLKVKYTNSILSAKRPITYADTLRDTFTADMTMGTVISSGGGYTEIIADGYGMLHLPDNAYMDVLRVRTEISETDSSITGSVTTYTNTKKIIYQWYSNNFNNPLLIWDSTSVVGGASFNETNVSYLEDKNLGLGEVSKPTQRYTGNITGNTLTLQGDFTPGKRYSITLMSLNGQKLYSATATGNHGTQIHNINYDLPSGMYVVAVLEQGQALRASTIKLLKQD